jgi:hypothetical protein
MSNDVCGTYIDLHTHGLNANGEMIVTIPVKINLHQFLILSSMRYLPSFCGRWEIELYPNWNNLVVLPCHPTANGHLSNYEFSLIQQNAAVAPNNWASVTKSFTQIGEPFVMIDSCTLVLEVAYFSPNLVPNAMIGTLTGNAATNSVVSVPVSDPANAVAVETAIAPGGTAWDFMIRDTVPVIDNLGALTPASATLVNQTQHLTCVDAEMDKIEMNLTTFQLRFEVFEGLRQMYAEQPLIIPTNILHYARFSGQPTDNTRGAAFHATLSQCLENCDSIFILVPNNTNQTTCFYQPYIESMRMALGEFGIHPQQYVNTFSDSRFLAMALDALNLETSEITAMNEDVARSLVSPRKINKFDTAAAGGANIVESWNMIEGDNSDFFIGISLSQVGFQAGTVSSPNTNIPFIFDAALGFPPNNVAPSPARDPEYAIQTSIICMFLIDAALMIQVVPNSDIPVVKLTNKSIV